MTTSNWSILLVDDDDTTNFLNNLLIKDILNNIEIVTKQSAIAALDYLDQLSQNEHTHRNLLILFDINMPAMNGFEFMNAFEQRTFSEIDTTIIMLTSSINRRDLERAKQYRLYDIMEKPLTSEKLNTIFAALGIDK